MDVQSEKIYLAKLLLDTEDEQLLMQIKELFEGSDTDFWDVLPDHVKAGIKRGRADAKGGKLVPHDEVIRRYAKYI